VVCCQVLHFCFQDTKFCNMCMKSVSSSFMSIIVTVFSFTYHLFSWRLTTNDSQLPRYFHILFIALNLKPTLHEIICLLLYIMWWKKCIFINATQKCVLLNYCMQRQDMWQPPLCLQWQRNLSWFEGHIHRPLSHKIQNNFREYFVGGGSVSCGMGNMVFCT